MMLFTMNKKGFLLKICSWLAAFALWQIAAMLVDEKILLVSPLDVFMRLGSIWKEASFFSTIGNSFLHIFIGFFAGLIVGMIFAVLAGKFKLFEYFISPYMITVKTVPVASFIIIALIWVSSAKLSQFISFLMVLPTVYTNVLNGIKNTDVKMLEMADAFDLSWRKRMLYIWIPQIRPFLISSVSISLGLAWKSGIAAELIGLTEGSIGEALYLSKNYVNTLDTLTWTVILVIISVAFEKAFLFFLNKTFAGVFKL